MSAPLADLERASRIVAADWEGPHCIDASALMAEVGKRLGYDLQPRAVSLFAFNRNTGGSVITGHAGLAFGKGYAERNGGFEVAGGFLGGSVFQRQAGHMVVVSDEHELLIDPTFAQFKQLGDQAVALFADKLPVHRSGRFWEVGDADFYVRYFAADAYLDEDLDLIRAAAISRAEEIATHLGY